MTTLHLIKSMGRSPSRLGLLLIPLVFACFALSPTAQAVGPEPNEGDLIVNMAEEDDAVPDLASDTQEAATGQAANNPNQRVIQIKPTVCDCVGASHEKVNLRGEFQISFKVGEFLGQRGVVRPVLPIKLSKGFKGTCPSTEATCLIGKGTQTDREYVAKKELKELKSSDKDENKWMVHSLNGTGDGRFLVGVVITAHPNSPPKAEANGRVVRWTLIYKIDYEWDRDKQVKVKVISRDVCGHP